MKITKEDFQNILEISNKHYLDRTTFVNPFARALKDWEDKKERNFKDSSEFYMESVAENKNLLIDIRDYFQKKYGQDIVKVYEEKCLSTYWNESIFVAYGRFIKDNLYYPQEPETILKIVKDKRCTNSKTLWELVSLSGYIKDNNESCNAFADILTEKAKNRNLSLLDLERIKRSWDKRFKNVDISNLPQNSLEQIQKVFAKIESSKTKNLYEFNSGEYIEVQLDADIISQENKLSVPKNIEAINIFFNRFKRYIDKSKTPSESLSINGFEFASGSISKLRVNFTDSSNKNAIKKVVKDLIDFCLIKDKNNLKGKTFLPEDEVKFFDAFIMNYALQEKVQLKAENKKNSFKI